MAIHKTPSSAQVGNRIEARGLHGQPGRQIIELLGRDQHQHYRVRWDEEHESIVYPADGVIITPQQKPRTRPTKR